MRGLFPEVDLARALRHLTDDPPKVQPGPGNPAWVGPNDTLGFLGGCWCGQHYGHDWPGKADGAPHPPYPE
jgi:hypothetical protein